MGVDSELRSLAVLFEDDNEIVVNGVNSRLIERGPAVIDDLKQIMDGDFPDEMRCLISDKIKFLSIEFTLNELKKEVSLEYPDLVNGIFLISKLITPSLERDYFDRLFVSLCGDLMVEISENHTAVEKVEILNHIFFKRLLFKSGDFPFNRESTSDIIPILSSRNGSPLSISILYFMFARFAGITIFPLCFKGGFITAYIENEHPLFYIDILKQGEIFFDDSLPNLDINGDSSILSIYLESLSMLYTLKEDQDRITLIDKALKLFGDERFLENDPEEE